MRGTDRITAHFLDDRDVLRLFLGRDAPALSGTILMTIDSAELARLAVEKVLAGPAEAGRAEAERQRDGIAAVELHGEIVHPGILRTPQFEVLNREFSPFHLLAVDETRDRRPSPESLHIHLNLARSGIRGDRDARSAVIRRIDTHHIRRDQPAVAIDSAENSIVGAKDWDVAVGSVIHDHADTVTARLEVLGDVIAESGIRSEVASHEDVIHVHLSGDRRAVTLEEVALGGIRVGKLALVDGNLAAIGHLARGGLVHPLPVLRVEAALLPGLRDEPLGLFGRAVLAVGRVPGVRQRHRFAVRLPAVVDLRNDTLDLGKRITDEPATEKIYAGGPTEHLGALVLFGH